LGPFEKSDALKNWLRPIRHTSQKCGRRENAADVSVPGTTNNPRKRGEVRKAESKIFITRIQNVGALNIYLGAKKKRE